jgi:hypothetical protein
LVRKPETANSPLPFLTVTISGSVTV